MVQEPPRRPIRWGNLRTDEAERVIRERFGGLSFTTEDIYWILMDWLT